MRRLAIFVLLFGGAIESVLASTQSGVGSALSLALPNKATFMEGLRERGVIPHEATAAEAEAIYHAHIQKLLGGGGDGSDPRTAALLRKGEISGQPISRHGRLTLPQNMRRDVVLTLLVEFGGSDTDPEGTVHTGRLHNETDSLLPWYVWVPDFSPEFYRQMLFDRNPTARSMANYFLEQSGRSYTLDGAVYGWVQVEHSEWYYGADSQPYTCPGCGGVDDLNWGAKWHLVDDAVNGACDVPWKNFDQEDPLDLDGDGNFNEPDGYVDHFQLVHAGTGQEQTGDPNDIWGYARQDFPDDIVTCDPDVRIGPHTLLPETGSMGEFAHEFAHTLGLPDLYDTKWSGNESVALWSGMATGYELGCPGQPAGTCPASLDAWSKYVLGWVKPIVVNPGEVKPNILLKGATSPGPVQKAIRINLPDDVYCLWPVNTPHSGSREWYAGRSHLADTTLTRQQVVSGNAQLTFWTWYDIEQDWDYGYVEVSNDEGANWVTLQGNITTTTNPNGNNQGNGITGSSPGWVQAVFDLSAYAGQKLLLRFRYSTDPFVLGRGWTIDDINIDGFSDDVEGGNQGWAADGWYQMNGNAKVNTPHSGSWEWWGGYGDFLYNTLTRQQVVPPGGQLTFWTWYDIEEGWDYGYVEVSIDGGASWTQLPGSITTTDNPYGNNEGYGVTGSSRGWVQAAFDLSAYGDQTVLLRFRYTTDSVNSNPGWTIDDINIDGFSDDVEGGIQGWTANGWSRMDGTPKETAQHYYMVEWRTPTGFDVSMNNLGARFGDLRANPGMLVWYRNGRYNENWVAPHPWAGRLLLVDSHPELQTFDLPPEYRPPGYPDRWPNDTFLQLVDAPFGRSSTYGEPWLAIPSLPGVPTFDDRKSYVDTTFAAYLNSWPWPATWAASSVMTPTYGLKVTVTKETPNAGTVNVDFGGYRP